MKKRYKIVLVIISLMLTLLVASIDYTVISSTKNIKPLKTDISLYVGESYILRIAPANVEVTFFSANKSIAAVDKTGKVTGVKAGKTIITITGTTGKNNKATVDVTVKLNKKVTLTFWQTMNSETPESLSEQERFQKKYPHININKVIVTESDGKDLIAAFAAGNNPDTAGIGQPQMTNFIYLGIPMPLDNYLKIWPDLPAVRKKALENFAIRGKHYALPTYSYVMVLNYNKKIFAEAGLKPPETWDELLETAKKLTVSEKRQWGFNLLISQWTDWWFEYFVWMAGGDLTKQNPDGTLKLTFTDPAVKTAIEFYRKLIAAKCIQPDLTLDYRNMQKQFAAGQAAMTLNGCDGYTSYINSGMKIEDIGYAELPIGPSGKRVSQIGGGCDFIFSNVSREVADAAWTWIAFKNSREEIEYRLKQDAAKGGAAPQVILRSDLNYSLGKIKPEIQAVVDKIASYARLEYYGKGAISGYVDAAVQKTALDPSVDILKEFKKQQDLAKYDVEAFNKEVLASKKK